ncbi:MAG: hypothetical protein DRP59_08530 [Spirochaetes bacterium]|nr:MAG: hypothetical protein DRP59_08530 [Spirochaetota bacterium]
MPGSMPCRCDTLPIVNTERTLIDLLKKLMATGAGKPPAVKIGLSPTEINIVDLLVIHRHLTLKDLSRLLELSPPTVSVAVKKMEESGLILKISNSRDKRVTILELSEKAENLFREIEKYRQAKVKKLVSNLNKEEQKLFLHLLDKAVK